MEPSKRLWITDSEKVTRIRALLATREIRRLLEEDPVAELKASLVSELDEGDYYNPGVEVGLDSESGELG